MSRCRDQKAVKNSLSLPAFKNYNISLSSLSFRLGFFKYAETRNNVVAILGHINLVENYHGRVLTQIRLTISILVIDSESQKPMSVNHLAADQCVRALFWDYPKITRNENERVDGAICVYTYNIYCIYLYRPMMVV